MKRYIFIVAAILGAAGAQAQTEEGLTKQLEVTREYTPHVGRAMKLPVAPDMTDTVRLRPEVSYHITSTASATSFSTSPFEAAAMSVAPFELERPLYVRLGLGAPFATEADVYFTPRTRAGSTFGIFANHSGSWSKIANDLGVKADAAEMTNAVGLFGSRQWSRYSLKGDVTYGNRLYNAYGVAPLDSDPSAELLNTFVFDKDYDRFKLGLLRAGLSIGDNFTDLSRFNFRVGVDAGLARLGRDNQNDLDFNLRVAKMFDEGKHGFEAELAEQGAFGGTMDYTMGGDEVHRGHAVSVSFMPRYVLKAGVWNLRAGLDARYIDNKRYNQSYLGFAPSLELKADLASGAFVPYISYTSRIVEGDRESLSRRNPFVMTSGMTAWVNDARLGFSGDLGDVFSYKLFGGLSQMSDYQLLVGIQDVTLLLDGAGTMEYAPIYFTPIATDGTLFTAGTEIGVHNLGGFGARLYGNWNKYDFPTIADATYSLAGDLPKYNAGVELSYRHEDIFSVRLGAEFIGERGYLMRRNLLSDEIWVTPGADTTYDDTIGSAVDISFAADAKVASDFWVFLEGKNLANQKLYPFPHYAGRGASVLGGVKIVF